MTNFIRTSFNSDPNLGLYSFATDKYCFLGLNNKKVSKKIKQTLRVPFYICPILNTNFSGIFVAGNSYGIVISKPVKYYDMYRLRHYFENILVLKTKYTAIGNLILMNDNGAILSPLLKKNKQEIKQLFCINCEISTIAKQRIVGNLGSATNRGCLLHPKVRQNEKKIVEDVLGVESDIGTVNYGSSYPGAGIIANSNGVVVSEQTSGPELGRIIEVFGFL